MRKKMLLVIAMLSAHAVWSADGLFDAETETRPKDIAQEFISNARFIADTSASMSFGNHKPDGVQILQEKIEEDYPSASNPVRRAAMCAIAALRAYQKKLHTLGQTFESDIFSTTGWSREVSCVDVEASKQINMHRDALPGLTLEFLRLAKHALELDVICGARLKKVHKPSDADMIKEWNDACKALQDATDKMHQVHDNALQLTYLICQRRVSSR